ncbi:MAG: ABC transporter permease [Candidatus Pacebacteria bacterium]|nr:ABC transporter permease [Candidatus Paceibacterota bacterium]
MNNFKMAYDNLKKNKSRMILTMIAVALGVAILIIMLASGAGLKEMILSEMDYYGSDVINIETRVPGKTATESSTDLAKGVVITTFKNSDVEKIRQHDNVEAVYSYVTGQEIIKREGESKNTLIFGYGAEAPNIEKIEIAEGRFYTTEEENSASLVVVLGSGVKEDLFGDEEAILKTVNIKGLSFRVVGVVKERGGASMMSFDDIVYIPVITMQKRILGTDYVLGTSIKVKDVSLIDETKEDLIYTLREEHDIKGENEDDFEAMTMEEMLTMVNSVVGGINALLVTLALVSLIVGGVGIMNIMYVSVTERTFEVGLKMALGAKKKDILSQFLMEAIILTLIGGVLGIVLGISFCLLFNYVSFLFSFGVTAVITISSIIFAFVFSMFLGLLAGVYPAKRASNLDPIISLTRK